MIISKNYLLKVSFTRYYCLNRIESLSFIKSKVLPFAIVSIFGIAFIAVSARIWLPGDMMAPAPIN